MSLQYQTEPEPLETADEQTAQASPLTVPYYSIILIVAQFAVDGKNAFLLGGETSTLLAGFVKPLFIQGEYWRILTGATLHGGVIHLLFNCYALYVLGKLIETLSNRAHLAIVFLLSAIGGGVLSLIFLPGDASVGASGGIVGFLGYLAAYGFLRRKLLSDAFLKNMLFNIGFMALYGIFINQTSDKISIDNYGHLGGLIVGAIYGFVQIPRDLYKDPREAGQATEVIGLGALGIFLAVCVFSILLIFRVV